MNKTSDFYFYQESHLPPKIKILTQQHRSGCCDCLLCSLIHSSSSSSACGISTGRRRVLAAQSQRRCNFIRSFALHMHRCDLQIFLHGSPHSHTHVRTRSRRERVCAVCAAQASTTAAKVWRSLITSNWVSSQREGRERHGAPHALQARSCTPQPAFTVAFLRRDREMAALSTSDRGCAERLRSSQHRSAAGDGDVSRKHMRDKTYHTRNVLFIDFF